jgi:hypothetical protein
MYTIKKEKIYNEKQEEHEECKETYEQNIEFKNTRIDISPILKDVEHCIKSGLEHKLSSFFYDFETYKQTHDEVLNLSVVKKLTNTNSVLHHTIRGMVIDHNRNTDTYHDSKYNTESNSGLEVIVLKRENDYLREELIKYQKKYNVLESEPINLEIKEKKCNCVCNCNTGISDNVDIINQIFMGQHVKNVILKESTEDIVAEESEDTEESEEEEEDEDTKESEEEEEDEDTEESEEEEEAEEAQAEEEEEAEEEAEEAQAEAEEEEAEEEEETHIKLPTFPTFITKNEINKEQHIDDNVNDVETESESEDIVIKQDQDKDQDKDEKKKEEEEEEEELYEVEINGVMYVTNDDEDGNIYSYINEEVGDQVGKFKYKNATIYEGKNKGTYDKTKCKFDF